MERTRFAGEAASILQCISAGQFRPYVHGVVGLQSLTMEAQYLSTSYHGSTRRLSTVRITSTPIERGVIHVLTVVALAAVRRLKVDLF